MYSYKQYDLPMQVTDTVKRYPYAAGLLAELTNRQREELFTRLGERRGETFGCCGGEYFGFCRGNRVLDERELTNP